MSFSQKPDSSLRDHQAWIGYLQPDGLVVSAQALSDQQVVIDKGSLITLQNRFRDFTSDSAPDAEESDRTVPVITDLQTFLTDFLEWPRENIAGLTPEDPIPDSLRLPLLEFNEELAPTFAFRDTRAASAENPWLLLVLQLPHHTDLDAAFSPHDRAWSASHTRRFERLLRETRVPIGLISNGTHFRLIYAPRGENTGTLTFPVAPMAEIAGRLILGAFHLLLDCYRLLSAATPERLPALLSKSREYQSAISETLARQVLEALYELQRGFQAADDRAHGKLLGKVIASDPDQVYAALITVLLRLVFVLYAEDRGLMPTSGLYGQNYAVHSLFERLRADAERYPDTMDHRYGAWPQLLALFRLIHQGCPHPLMKMPARGGDLFDPLRFPFLEGHPPADPASADLPLLSDGTLFRVLTRLLVLRGERLSYRTLDVWHIGGVYQQMMGFQLQTAAGPSIAIRAPKTSGAPAIVDLNELLAVKPAERAKWLTTATGQKFKGEPEKALKSATTANDLLATLDKKIDRAATPHPVPAGAMILQPSDERRRSGSHYTPPALTGPIVRKTLAPILKRLAAEPKDSGTIGRGGKDFGTVGRGDVEIQPRGGAETSQSPSPIVSKSPSLKVPTSHSLSTSLLPTPQQILDLKICDPAMGSAAFLVEVCRQLAELLVASWHAYGLTPRIPPDEDEVLHARRLIAQRCLYGVDRNPLATDLAKLSLWLATLAKDHPFTFLDHAFRTGDALVGLGRKQIAAFHWDPNHPTAKNRFLGQQYLEFRLKTATALRRDILEGDDFLSPLLKAEKLRQADDNLDYIRLAGDLAIAAFFSEEKDKARQTRRDAFLTDFTEGFPGSPVVDKSNPDALRNSYAAANRCRAIQRALRGEHLLESESPKVEGTEPTPGHELAASTRAAVPAALASSKHPVLPFHWEIEFPEVFARENGGFDAFIGNPPYGGKNTLVGGNHESYLEWLMALHAESHGNADLVAHFFRRSFHLLRRDGTFGLIATNTIRQGDTRHTGLRWICVNSGTIYAARRRYKWIGAAAVVVSVVWVAKGTLPGPFDLDGQSMPIITAYLFHDGGHDNPAALKANTGHSFIGSYVLGMGFTFDDTDKKGVASPLADMKRLIAENPSNAERIFPYLGGEEVNDSPTHANHRYVINFADFPLRRDEDSDELWFDADEKQQVAWLRTSVVPKDYPGPVAADWPDLLSIVERKVKADRMNQGSIVNPVRWYRFARPASDLAEAVTTQQLSHVLVCCRVQPNWCVTPLPASSIFAESIVVFTPGNGALLAMLQSNIHEFWGRFFSSSLKDDMRYAPSDCFETFPFPAGWETDAALEAAGREYYEARAALMVSHDEGLTKTYNRFHDPSETAPGILTLRRLHAAMDHAVLAAYGWSDLVETGRTACEFIPDYYDDPKEEGGDPLPKSIRHRWPDATRDEVLARLLKLNAARAEEEALAGEALKKKTPLKKAARKSPQRTAPPGPVSPDVDKIVPFPVSPPELFPEFVRQPELPAAYRKSLDAYTQGFSRQLLAAEILWQCRDEPTMGRVKLQKLVHLCEYVAEIPELDSSYQRAAAGPFDSSLMIAIQNGIEKQHWFKAVKSDKGTRFEPMEKAGEHQKYLSKWSGRLAAMQQVIGIFKEKKTQSCEIASTLYAAWNDFLIEGLQPTDDQILGQASKEYWHAKKEEISPERWAKGLTRLKELQLTPKGWGTHTKKK